MSETILRYKIFCITENAYQYIWLNESENAPTTCPVNTGHTVNTSLVRIVEERASSKIHIQQESVLTGGHYRWLTIVFDAAPNTETIYTFSYPFHLSMLSAMYQSAEENRGDTMTWIISPNSTVGAIVANVSIGDTTFYVSSTVTDYISIGFACNLYDGINTDDVGIVIAIDAEAGTITCTEATTHNFLAASPTFVRMGIYFCKEIEFGHPGRMCIGDTKVESSYVPANTQVEARYDNKTGVTKRLVYNLEVMY